MDTAKALFRRRAFTRVVLVVALSAIAVPVALMLSAENDAGGLTSSDCCPLSSPLPSLTGRIVAPDCPIIDGKQFPLEPILPGPGEEQVWASPETFKMGDCSQPVGVRFRLRCPIIESTRQGPDDCFNYELQMVPTSSGCASGLSEYHPAIACDCDPFALAFDGFCLKSNQYCPNCCDCCCQPPSQFQIIVELPQ